MMADGRPFAYEVAILPLSADDERVGMLIVAMDFDTPR